MSSLIEQAAARLEQLRRAGAVVGEAPAAPRTPGGGFPAGHGGTVAAAAPTVASRTVELDFASLAAQGLLTPESPRSTLGDEMRVIKRPLIRNAFGKGAIKVARGNLIMVTSALAGEGKSFTSVNLAMSIAAELDHTVMLVDADVARPSLSRMLGLNVDGKAAHGQGLLDVLDGTVDMHEVIVRTNVDKLSILPSGTQHARATELLASDAMSRLLDEMGRRYADRVIIFDSPPLLLTTEARVLASHMGQIVVVVHAEKTLQEDVQAALTTIEACPVRLMVLNQAHATRDGGYGGYGYGYGYGYGQGDGAAAESTLDAPLTR